MSGLGIDTLLAGPGRYLPGRRVALLANQASLTSTGTPTLEALRLHPDIELAMLLTAEHGFSGYEDDATPIDDRRDARTGLPLHSLYGPRRRPDPRILEGLDAVVIDVQEVGMRCYTYAATAALVCEACAAAGTRVVLCDRPNPLGTRVDGPALDPALRSFLGYLDVPYQHGRTIGEIVAWGVRNSRVDLVVLPAERSEAAEGAAPRSPFVPPSPGLPTRESVMLYPGLVLLEGVNLNEGRGTTLPFQLIGAPWLDGYALAAELTELGVPGLAFRPVSYVPRSDAHAGLLCHGVQLLITDPHALEPLPALARILAHVRREHPSRFRWVEAAEKPWAHLPGAGEPWHEPVTGLLVDALTGDDSVRRIVEGRTSLEDAQADWSRAAADFGRRFDQFASTATALRR